MYDNHFTCSNVSIPCVLGPMAMTLSKFIEILRPPLSPKVIENTGKVPMGFPFFVTSKDPIQSHLGIREAFYAQRWDLVLLVALLASGG